MRLHELTKQLGQYHPDSQVDMYHVVPSPDGTKTYMKLEPETVYLEDGGAVITIELTSIGVRQ
jgi:hypothetical protein